MVHQWVFIKWFKFVDVTLSNFINKCTNLEKKHRFGKEGETQKKCDGATWQY